MEEENFVWHRVSDKEREKIKKQAKKIMDDFVGELDKAGEEEIEIGVKRDTFMREEGDGEDADEKFRKTFFDNAVNKKGNCIIAEKGGWI